MSQSTPMNPQRLDPARLAAAREQVLQSMRKRHTVAGNEAWTLLASGGIVLFILGWAIAFALMVLHAFFVGYDKAWSVFTFYVIYLIAVVAFLIVQERSTRGGFFSFASSDVDLRRDPENSAEYLVERSRTHVATFIEYVMWAPRAFIAGYRGLMGIHETGLDAILPEAADVMTRMLSLDVGVKLTDLALPGTDPMQMMPVLKWLDTHDYIGFSTRGDKVWVSSPAKKRFQDDGVIVPKVNTAIVPDSPKVSPKDPKPESDDGPIELA